MERQFSEVPGGYTERPEGVCAWFATRSLSFSVSLSINAEVRVWLWYCSRSPSSVILRSTIQAGMGCLDGTGSSVYRTRRFAGTDSRSFKVSPRRLRDRADGYVRPTLYPRDNKVADL